MKVIHAEDFSRAPSAVANALRRELAAGNEGPFSLRFAAGRAAVRVEIVVRSLRIELDGHVIEADTRAAAPGEGQPMEQPPHG